MERGVELYVVHLRKTQLQQFEAVGLCDLVSTNRAEIGLRGLTVCSHQLGHDHFQPDLRSTMQIIGDRGAIHRRYSRYA
jgi:hypothetical protein